MRDQVAIEALGVPVVMVVTGVLEAMARATARAHGLPGLRLVVVDGLLYGQPRERIAAIAAPFAPAVEAGLLDG